MGRKRGWRKNTWAPRPISPEPDESSPEPWPEPWEQDPELSYSEPPYPDQHHLGPYPIHQVPPPRYHHTPYSHPYYRHQSPDPSEEVLPVPRNLDSTAPVLATQGRLWLILDALKKATGRIECWWPELRDDGMLKMEWRPEREVVIPIPERGVGYNWGHGRPERVVLVDLMNLNLGGFGVKGGFEILGGERFEGGEEEMSGWWGDGEEEGEEGEMDFKCEKGKVGMGDAPVYCRPPLLQVPTTTTRGPEAVSEYGYEEMMKWILGKQGPEVLPAGDGVGQRLQMAEAKQGDEGWDVDNIL